MRRDLALLIAATAIARADVIFEEPTRMTCGRSEVIVAGIVDALDAPGAMGLHWISIAVK